RTLFNHMKELIEAARGAQRADVDRLLTAVWPSAYHLAYAMLGDRQQAEDAAQEACVALFRSIGSLRSAEAFRVWFSRIVVREAGAIGQRRKRTEPVTLPAPERFDSDSATALDVWRALDSLPGHLRKVVVLRYFEDFTSSQIATVLGIPAPTVRFRLMVARRRLRPLLDDGTMDFTQGVSHAIEF
ncbi:MAG TPA: RNA polymerase sigma factor, partial [Candidatus Tumulicola sp.]